MTCGWWIDRNVGEGDPKICLQAVRKITKNKTWKYSLCNFLQTSSFLSPNIFLRTLFPYSLRPRYSLNIRDQVSHPYKATDKIMVANTLIFTLLCRKLEGKRFWIEWYQNFPEFNQILISSRIQAPFVSAVPKGMHCGHNTKYINTLSAQNTEFLNVKYLLHIKNTMFYRIKQQMNVDAVVRSGCFCKVWMFL
jgi:hypothetical protein